MSMDPELARLIDNDTPKLNPLLANGLATYHMQGVEKYIEDMFRSVSRDFPKGLHFVKGERCTPQEEFNEQTKKRANKSGKSGSRRTYDVARSDLYMMKYTFRYQGVDLDPRYLYLPFVGDAGTITISGSRWVISPVLVDRVISVGISNVFVQLNKTRLTFKRLSHQIMIDDTPHTAQVVWSKVHQGQDKHKGQRRGAKAMTTMMHYLLCKFGFSETFAMFGNCHPVALTDDADLSQYPPEEWAIISSSTAKLRRAARSYYERSKMRVAIRRSEITHKVLSMMGGMFYVVDHYPTRALAEHVNSKRMWKILMGELIPSDLDAGAGHLFEEADKHMQSLDKYIDTITHDKLKDIGMPVKNIYEMFSIIIGRFNEWLLNGTDKVSSMYDKELSILYYVLRDIIFAINNTHFRLKAAEEKAAKAGKELTADNINGILFDLLKTGLIFHINKKHGEVSTISSPGDNKAFKLTSVLVAQTDTNQTGGNRDRSGTNDPSRHLHGSIAEFGSYANLPKSNPYGKGRLNQAAEIDENNVLIRNPTNVPLVDSVQEKIRR